MKIEPLAKGLFGFREKLWLQSLWFGEKAWERGFVTPFQTRVWLVNSSKPLGLAAWVGGRAGG